MKQSACGTISRHSEQRHPQRETSCIKVDVNIYPPREATYTEARPAVKEITFYPCQHCGRIWEGSVKLRTCWLYGSFDAVLGYAHIIEMMTEVKGITSLDSLLKYCALEELTCQLCNKKTTRSEQELYLTFLKIKKNSSLEKTVDTYYNKNTVELNCSCGGQIHQSSKVFDG